MITYDWITTSFFGFLPDPNLGTITFSDQAVATGSFSAGELCSAVGGGGVQTCSNVTGDPSQFSIASALPGGTSTFPILSKHVDVTFNAEPVQRAPARP